MESVFVLVETEVSINVPKGASYSEAFSSMEKAQERMRDMYKESVIDNYENVEHSEFTDTDASAEFKDGTCLYWTIGKYTVQ